MYKGIGYLKAKLNNKRVRVLTRYKYYEMKNRVNDFRISTPPELLWFSSTLGWCAKAVDSLADRLSVKEIRNDIPNMSEIFSLNNPDVFFNSAILSSLVTSCCFVYVSNDENGYPRLQVIDGSNATGILDPITNFLKEGYAVLERDENDNVIAEAYFTAEQTDFYFYDGRKSFSLKNKALYPALVPIIYRPDAKREFGHSRISRACMDIQDSAVRTLKRSEISAEFYSYPQKYVTGLDPDAESLEKWKATMSSMLSFSKDMDGDKPTVGQFQQQSMSPHFDQLRALASLFGGETGLTLDDLGFATTNPSSAEAIKAAHENLRMSARKAQGNFSSGFINVGIVACSYRDSFPYERKAFYKTKVIWEPVFEPDFSALSSVGDGAIKLNQAVPNFLDKTALEDITGIVGSDE